MIVQHTPPMGWNTWNTFAEKVNEQLILESADAMVESGLQDAGYQYLVIDDTWTEKRRDKNHHLVVNREKFPNGIKPIADYLHQRGLKLGVYSCVGNMTCTQHPGSYEHEFIDAADFAAWGIDFLKYDYCFKPIDEKGYLLYRRMGIALANCGRDILFSACSWGTDDTAKWIKTTGAHMWRSTHDIIDSWESIKKITREQQDMMPFHSRGCFNDMDILVVGMYGQGHVGLQGCDYIQYRTHFSLWAFLGSPLMIGCDIRHMSEETRSILLNKEVIALNQDPAYCQPFQIGGFCNFRAGGSDECFILGKLLASGDIAVGIFNLSENTQNFYFAMSEIGLNRTCGKKLVMTDLWSGECYETIDTRYAVTLAPHDCQLLIAKVVDED